MIFSSRHSQIITFEITSADVLGSIQAINAISIPVYNFVWNDPLNATVQIDKKHWTQCSRILEKRGDNVKISNTPKNTLCAYLFFVRPVLSAGLILLSLLLYLLPEKILFIQVEGNHTVPRNVIIEAADSCGIHFLSPRKEVRSEKMKNALLSAVPELQWAGINTYGCIAVISVQERAEPDHSDASPKTVSSIIAANDGVISSVTALNGNLLCKVGQTVKKGEVLISGYTDCGLCIQATRASGEIIAQTSHYVQGMYPISEYHKGSNPISVKSLSLILGKKRIKIWKDSGIRDSTCGRIYKEYPLKLPGGYTLPIALACDTVFANPISETDTATSNIQSELQRHTQKYLCDQMIAGNIRSSHESFSTSERFVLLQGNYICSEMIGREHTESIGDQYGKNS